MAWAGVENIAAYLVVATFIGAANAFEMPVRQTLIRDIVEERALITSALGISAMVFNVGRLVGPAIAGLVLAYFSEAWCFAINALSYFGIIVALVAMRLPPQAPRGAASGTMPEGFAASVSTILAFPAVRYLLPPVVAIGLFATPYVPLMPSIVAEYFDGRSSTLGLLISSAAVGALTSAGYLSLQPGYGRQLRLLALAPMAVGLSLMCFAWSRALPVSCVMLAVLGGSAMIAANSTNAMLQQSVPDAWRGRVVCCAHWRSQCRLVGGPCRPHVHVDVERGHHRGRGAARPLAAPQSPGGPASDHARAHALGTLSRNDGPASA
jgi:MFS family permease